MSADWIIDPDGEHTRRIGPWVLRVWHYDPAGKPGPNHDLARLSAVHRCYAAALARAADAGHRLAFVDARGTPDEVHARIIAAINPLL